MRAQISSILTASLLVLSYSSVACAGRKVVNNGDKPFAAVQLRNRTGEIKTAKIYILPRGEMVFGDDGWPVSGAGYIEAEKERTYYVPFRWKGKDGLMAFGGIRVQRIDWDKEGRLVSIKGLAKQFDAEPNLEISSDIGKPRIVDGILFLTFKERGKVEYRLNTLFGKGVPLTGIEPDGL